MRITSTILLAVSLSACAAPAARERDDAGADGSSTELAHARDTLAAGNPRDALTELDLLLERAPDDAAAWVLRGQACLAAAQNDTQPGFYYVDALRAFERAIELDVTREALLGASRAARLNLEPDKALGYVRRAEVGGELDAEQARVAIEASFDCYIARRQVQADASELYRETERRLLDLVARTPDDVWTLNTLANLFQWEGRTDAAVEPLAHVVRVSADDESAHNRLVPVLRTAEGSDAVVAFYESFRAEQPGNALGAWYLAQELFEQAINDLYAQQDSSAKFARADELFRECRQAKASYEQSCLNYEVMCRNGVGWCRFNAGDLFLAEKAFLAMESLFPGGIEWQIEGRLSSGIAGLQLIADRVLQESATGVYGESAGIDKAAELYGRLHALRPSDANFANNCGFFQREIAVGRITRGMNLAHAASLLHDAVKKATLAAEVNAVLATARDALRISRDAYLDAAKLAPDDVRIVNDAALILVYHFPSRTDEAEQLLLRSVQHGTEQKDDAALDEQTRDALLEAWGDAHQNLGVLELLHRHRPAVAKEWFRKAFDIGPRPRVDRAWITDVALPACERALAGESLDPRDLDPRIWYAE